MSDILTTYYIEKYSNQKTNGTFYSQKNNSKTDPILSNKGHFLFLTSSNKYVPLSTNFLHYNKNLYNPQNIFHQTHSSLTSLTKRQASNSAGNIFSNKYNFTQRRRDSFTSIINQKIIELLKSSKTEKVKKIKKDKMALKAASEYHDRVINPMIKIKQNFNYNPEDLTLFKGNSALSNCFVTPSSRNEFIIGVNDYKKYSEKYIRLQLSKMNPYNLYTKNNHIENLMAFQHSHQNEFKYKNMMSNKLSLNKISKYPIDLQMLSAIKHRTFDDRIKRAKKIAEKALNIVMKQKKNIDQNIKNLNNIK